MSKRQNQQIAADHSLMFFKGQYLFQTTNPKTSETSYKFVSAAAVKQAFAGEATDSGWLSPDVVRCGASGNGEWAVMFMAAHSRKIHLDGAKTTIEVPLPSLIFFGIAARYYVWATKETAFNPHVGLFRAPLSNVHDNGGICFGSNKPPRCTGAAIADAWLVFMTSPFNGDLATGKLAKHDVDIRIQLRLLAKTKATAYPLADLVRLGNYSDTAEKVIDSLIKE